MTNEHASAHSELDSVDWAATWHAFGPATDIPEHLAALGATDARVRAEALESLYEKLRHQGTLYQATAVAVPFLLRLAADPTLPNRAKVVGLVAHLAVGYDEEWLPDTIPITRVRARLPFDRQTADRQVADRQAGHEQVGDDPASRHAPEAMAEDIPEHDAEVKPAVKPREPEVGGMVWSLLNEPVDVDDEWPFVQGWLACYDAVRAGVPLFQRLLTEPDAATRSQAAYALAWFPEHTDGTIPVLTGAVRHEPDPMVAATMLVALGLLAEPANTEVQALLDSQLRADQEWRRWGAAVAQAAVAVRSGREVPPDRTQPVLAELARGIRDYSVPAERDDRRPRWLFGRVRGLSALYLVRLGPIAVAPTIAAVAAVLPSVDIWDGEYLVEALLVAAFPDGPPDAPPPLETLTANQRQALAALADAPNVRRMWNTEQMIKRYQLTPLLPKKDVWPTRSA
jgi:hypothetical protein